MSEKKKSRRLETITVMFIPSLHGKPVQFQTTRRFLTGIITAGIASFVLTIVFISVWTFGVISDMRHEKELQIAESNELRRLKNEAQHSELMRRDAERQSTASRKRYDDLKRLHDQYSKDTESKIDDLQGTISKIADFTGLPLETPTTATLPDGEPGKGGPLTRLLDMSSPAARSQFLIGSLQRLELHLQQLDLMKEMLEKAYRHLQERETLTARTPLIVPILGEYSITDRYGTRTHPIFKRKDFHSGLDFAAKAGTEIIAPADGKVIFTGVWSKKPGYGKVIRIDHGEGLLFEEDGTKREVKYNTRYAHCMSINVEEGQTVKRGDVIGTVGSTGYSTGNHLHYEVLVDGENVDPAHFVLNIK